MRIVGFFRLKDPTGNKSFIVFNNFLHSPVPINELYDLKGSKKDREVSQKELNKAVPVQLDLDFIKSGRSIYLGENKEAFLEQLARDTDVSFVFILILASR